MYNDLINDEGKIMKMKYAIKFGIKTARVKGIKKGIQTAIHIYRWADKARW